MDFTPILTWVNDLAFWLWHKEVRKKPAASVRFLRFLQSD